MRRFLVDKKDYFTPRGFDECTTEQVGMVVAYQLGLQVFESAKERTQSKVALLCALSKFPQSILQKLTAGQVQRMLSMIAWCKHAKITDRRPFASFTFQKMVYVLPAANLADTAAIELAMCTIFDLAFTRTEHKNIDAIFSILGTVCRPARKDLKAFQESEKWSGDTRQAPNTTAAEQRAAAFKEMPYGVAIAIYMYWSAMVTKFWKRHDDLLEETDEIPMYQNGEGQVTMLMDVAEMGTFGNFEAVCEQNVHTIYLFLKDKKKKAERLEQMQKQDTENG
jgi:hypothetical protein